MPKEDADRSYVCPTVLLNGTVLSTNFSCPTVNIVPYDDGSHHEWVPKVVLTDAVNNNDEGRPIGLSETLLVSNGSDLSLRDGTIVVGPAYDIDYVSCGVPCRTYLSAISVSSGSSLRIEARTTRAVVDGGPPSSDGRYGARGVLCRGAASNVKVWGNSTIRGGNLTENTAYDGYQVPGYGLEVSDGCTLTVMGDEFDEGSGVLVSGGVLRSENKNGKPVETGHMLAINSAVKIDSAVADFCGGTFMGCPALKIESSNVTIKGGSFQAIGRTCSGFSPMSLFMKGSQIDIYGGSFDGFWDVAQIQRNTLVVHGKDLTLVESPRKYCASALRLTGTLCDGTDISVIMNGVFRWDDWSLPLFVDDCDGGPATPEMAVVGAMLNMAPDEQEPEQPAAGKPFPVFQVSVFVVAVAVVAVALVLRSMQRQKQVAVYRFQEVLHSNTLEFT